MNRTLRPAPRRAFPAACLTALLLAACAGDSVAPSGPAHLGIHSGDGQTARAGTEAPEPVRVRVTDQGGASASGVAVTFDVTAGGGSVPAPSAVSDANGIASPGRWTLGAPGPQELVASVPGLAPVVFGATALGVPAEIAVAAGADQEATVATAVAVPPEVLVTDSDGAPAAGVVVAFATDSGASVANAQAVTDERGRVGPGSWTLGARAGRYALAASVEDDGVAGNPVRIEAVALAGPVAALTALEGDGQETEAALPVAVPPRVRAEDAHGNPVSGAEVGFLASGDSEVAPRRATTDDDGVATVALWVMGRSAGTTYRLVASVALEDGSEAAVTFSALAKEPVYDIRFEHVGPSDLTGSQIAALGRAERFWERAIAGNLESHTVREAQLKSCLAKSQIDGTVTGDRLVDDLLIFLQVRHIDGPAGVFAGAGPCVLRTSDQLPIVGTLYLDQADVEVLDTFGELEATIVHEIAHVLGFGGNYWEHRELLRDPAGRRPNADTRFTGDSAFAAFAGIRGDHYADADAVPVQNLGGEGVWNGHWNEFVFRHELMTPFPDKGVNPVSVVTLASLVDLGYDAVDMSTAEDYVLPPPLFARMGEPGDSLLQQARPKLPRDRTFLGDDIVRVPLTVIDRDGTVVRILPANR